MQHGELRSDRGARLVKFVFWIWLIPPVLVSSSNVDDRTVKPVVCWFRSSTVKFWNPGVAARILGKFGGLWSSWTQRLTRQFFSWSIFRAHIQETWGFGYTQCFSHFPKDRNCKICQRTKITRAPCRRRNGGAVPRAEIFGDLITADHKVLSENCESRNNHRYAVVVQDLATLRIQSYPCKTETSQETQRSLQKFLEPDRKPKDIYTDNSLEFGKACEDLSWNHCTSTPHGSETNGIAESSAQSKGRHLCCIVVIRSEWKLVGRFHGTLFTSAKRHRSVIWWEDALWKTFWATIFWTDYSIWFIGWVSPYNCEGSVKNPSIWKESLTWIVPRIRSVRGRNLEGWRTGCRPWGVGDDGRIGNLLKKTQCERGDISQTRRIIFPIADGRIKTLGGDQDLRTSTLVRHRPIQGESHVDFLGESEGSLPPPQDSLPDAGEAMNEFWSMSGNFMYRHHVKPRVKLYLPREESFPIPLKYIDVSRTTHSNLDVKQEKRIDDYWNIDGSRDLLDPWTGFTQFTLLEEKPPNGYRWCGGRLTREQLTSRPYYLCRTRRKWERMQRWSRSKSGHMKSSILITRENCEGSISLTRRTRNSKKPSRMLVRNWRHQWLLLCLVKLWKIAGVVHPTKLNKNLRVFRNLMNPQECVWEIRYRIIMKTILQEKVTIHYSIIIWFTNLILCLKLWKFLQQKQRWTRNGKQLENISAWNLTKVRSKEEVIDEARMKGAQVHFASLMDICHLKSAELEAKHQKYKGRVVLRGDIVKDDSGSYAVFTEQGSSASQMTAASHGHHLQTALLHRTSSWRSICLYPGKNGRCSQIVENSKIGVSRHLDSSTTTQMAQNHGPVWKTQSFLLSELCTVILWQDCYGKGNLRKSYCSPVGRKFPTGNAYSYTVKKGYSYVCMQMTSNLLERNKTLIRCGMYSIKKSIWENQLLSLIMYTSAALKDNVK